MQWNNDEFWVPQNQFNRVIPISSIFKASCFNLLAIVMILINPLYSVAKIWLVSQKLLFSGLKVSTYSNSSTSYRGILGVSVLRHLMRVWGFFIFFTQKFRCGVFSSFSLLLLVLDGGIYDKLFLQLDPKGFNFSIKSFIAMECFEESIIHSFLRFLVTEVVIGKIGYHISLLVSFQILFACLNYFIC